MRIQLQLDDVQARGGERIDDATHWPVYFALDATVLRALAGDVAASDWMEARGPATPGSKLAWQHTFPGRTGSAEGARIGFGLLYSAGGRDDSKAEAAYRELAATAHTLVLGQVARANGLAALLAGFGGRAAPGDPDRGPDLDELRGGIDPERLSDRLDTGLTRRFAAFEAVAEALRPLAPGATVPPRAEVGGPPEPAPVPRPTGPIAPLEPGSRPRASRVAPGTVVAVTLQVWRVDEIPPDRPLQFARPLPTRGALRASLRLSGRLIREA